MTEEQIVKVLHEWEADAKVADLVRRHGVTETTLYRWRHKYSGLPPHRRNASLIMLASPHPLEEGRWAVKVRLGIAAPARLTLADVRLTELDPAFGGRWNAGSKTTPT